jgi:7-carboxy-7-deazaguanine synthase
MLVRELIRLSQQLRDRGCHVTIETAGTVDLAVPCDLMSISPKLSNSTPNNGRRPGTTDDGWQQRHDHRRHRPGVMRRLTSDYDYQLKFVIDQPADVAEVEQYLMDIPSVSPDRVYLMPQATDPETLREKSRWLANLLKQRRWQLSPRLHVERWGNQRGV